MPSTDTEYHPSSWVEDRLGVLYRDAEVVNSFDLDRVACTSTPESLLLCCERYHFIARLARKLLRHDDATAVLSVLNGEADSGAAAARAAGVTEVRFHRAIRRLSCAVAELQ